MYLEVIQQTDENDVKAWIIEEKSQGVLAIKDFPVVF